MNALPVVTVSVVSHLQGALVAELLSDLERYCGDIQLEVILTLNLPEVLVFKTNERAFPIHLQVNEAPLGFSANHNQAFRIATGRFFCVVNPDIRMLENPFASLLHELTDPAVGVVAPLVLRPDHAIEDSVRRFPSPLKILCKFFGKCQGNDYAIGSQSIRPDWVAGMFLLFPRDVFAKLGGFDQRYFLYYEDVDICARLRLSGLDVLVCPHASVIHHAQRSSHRSGKYLRWHLMSMMRFFFSPVYWRLQMRRLQASGSRDRQS